MYMCMCMYVWVPSLAGGRLSCGITHIRKLVVCIRIAYVCVYVYVRVAAFACRMRAEAQPRCVRRRRECCAQEHAVRTSVVEHVRFTAKLVAHQIWSPLTQPARCFVTRMAERVLGEGEGLCQSATDTRRHVPLAAHPSHRRCPLGGAGTSFKSRQHQGKMRSQAQQRQPATKPSGGVAGGAAWGRQRVGDEVDVDQAHEVDGRGGHRHVAQQVEWEAIERLSVASILHD